MSFVNTVDIVGDEALTNSFIDRSIREIADNLVTKINDSSFRGCSKLTTADFRAATEIKDYAFYGCSALTTVNLSVATLIDYNAFNGCSALTTLILRSGTICSLNFSSLQKTPIASGTGYIYVPRALLDSYKAASGWSTYASQFRALEDYTVDGTITGALDESKI